MNREGKRVFVGLSGGVDSAVSAALLKEAGCEVTGVFIKVWQADFLPCSWRTERRDAMRVAAHLGIPFVTLDLSETYKQEVIDHMISEYAAGRVPNPDVLCNQHVKFGAFFSAAVTHGADAIATGHYARILPGGSGEPSLAKGVDPEKDQSYFLWAIDNSVLSKIHFPVGELKKSEVRVIADRFGLPNATKKDSQGLCFLGPVDMADFLSHYLTLEPGKVLDQDGNEIGMHKGALVYAIGQRHGFTTKKTTAHEEPYIVIRKDLDQNTITVAPKSLARGDTQASELKMHSSNIIDQTYVCAGSRLAARYRYRGPLQDVMVQSVSLEDHTLTIAPSSGGIERHPGQSVVLYHEDLCVGGGIAE